jgi:hypothetical protein
MNPSIVDMTTYLSGIESMCKTVIFMQSLKDEDHDEATSHIRICVSVLLNKLCEYIKNGSNMEDICNIKDLTILKSIYALTNESTECLFQTITYKIFDMIKYHVDVQCIKHIDMYSKLHDVSTVTINKVTKYTKNACDKLDNYIEICKLLFSNYDKRIDLLDTTKITLNNNIQSYFYSKYFATEPRDVFDTTLETKDEDVNDKAVVERQIRFIAKEALQVLKFSRDIQYLHIKSVVAMIMANLPILKNKDGKVSIDDHKRFLAFAHAINNSNITRIPIVNNDNLCFDVTCAIQVLLSKII